MGKRTTPTNPGYPGLCQRHKILAAALQHLLVEPAHRILREMRRVPMRVRCRRIFVLLVDENGVGIALNAMRDVADAAGLLARSLGEQAQNLGNVIPVFRRELHPDSKAEHGKKSLLLLIASIRILFNPLRESQPLCSQMSLRRDRTPGHWGDVASKFLDGRGFV